LAGHVLTINSNQTEDWWEERENEEEEAMHLVGENNKAFSCSLPQALRASKSNHHQRDSVG
jgi:hypothetical protein